MQGHALGTILLVLAVGLPSWAGVDQHPTAVWIDTDPACGAGPHSDVDDCFALLYALRSAELRIVGVSTVFGNTSLRTTNETLRRLLDQPHMTPVNSAEELVIRAGASEPAAATPYPETPASDAIAHALRRQRLTLIALGPLTNVATLIERHPVLAQRIDTIVAVAGTRPGERLPLPGREPIAALPRHELQARSGCLRDSAPLGHPLVLLPFEASRQIEITSEDLQRLRAVEGGPRWLAEQSEGWLAFWQKSLGASGFRPFDSLAVGWVVAPELFACSRQVARVRHRRSVFFERSALEVTAGFDGGRPVLFCTEPLAAFKESLIERLTISHSPSPGVQSAP